MTASTPTQILFPAGRLVQGSLYNPQEKDQQGKPLTIKTGPNAGQPTKKWFFALAIPKQPGETHWGLTPWGQQILAIGRAAFPNGQAEAPTFAWKCEDGDSVIPNKLGRKNADREGFPGHWVVNFSSQFAPKIVTSTGDPLLEPNAVKLGFWVGVLGSVAGNDNQTNPGVYVNHVGVAYLAPGKEIQTGPDLRAVGFDKLALPAGVTAQPPGTFPGAPAAGGGLPPPPGGQAPPPAAGGAPPPSQPVQQSATFIPPAAGGLPPPPGGGGAPPPPAGPQMTAKATAAYKDYIAAGWNDAQLRAQGLMV